MHLGLPLLLPFRFRSCGDFRRIRRSPYFRDKTTQTVRNKIREPRAAESCMGLYPPHGKFSDVQLHALKGIEQTGQAVILEGGDILKLGAILKLVNAEAHEWPPLTACGMYQPHRPEMSKPKE